MVAHPNQDHEGHELIPETSEDRDLTLSFQRGEKGSYQAIYQRFEGRVHSVCRRILVNPDDAAEASQESFLRIYQALGRFNGRYQLGAWITRITTNVCLDHLRARNRRGGEYWALELEDLENAGPVDDHPDEIVVRRWESRRVRKVLESLPPLHRAAIALRDFEGLTYEEVAIALGITDSQVKALLHRARQRFKRAWLHEVASVLVPWRLFDRLRGTDIATRDTSAVQAATSAVNAAPACTTMLQHCGQYVAERVAPVFTALVVGTATGGALVNPSTPAHSANRLEKGSGGGFSADVLFGRRGPDGEEGSPKKARRRGPLSTIAAPSRTAAAPQENQPAPAPAPQPTPAPTTQPTPQPQPSPSESQSGTTSGGAGGTASLSVLELAVGFDRGKAIPTSKLADPSKGVDCNGPYLKQQLETVIWDGDESYPASISTNMSPNGLGVRITITKGAYVVTYPGAAYVDNASRSGNFLVLHLSGTYGTHPDADRAGLPHSGSLSVVLKLDCVTRHVVHESLMFGTMPNDNAG